MPFTSHTAMEPMNCTVKLSPDKAEIWIPTQSLEASLAALSSSSGMPLEKCEAYVMDLGGGFGRRIGNQDVVRQGVAIAKAFPGVPVKMVWTREEDQAHQLLPPSHSVVCLPALTKKAIWQACICGCRASRSMPLPIRLRSRTARIFASCRACGRHWRVMRRSATPMPTCVPNMQCAIPIASWSVARRQHQPERHFHGMLHGRGGEAGEP